MPRYVPAIPVDRFSAKPFSYRVSKGEEVKVTTPEGGWWPLRVPPGQGIIFTEGDYGITVLVPMWPKK